MRRRLTLVSAPAGFGKTTCVAEWIAGVENRPVAWLSLDPADDDPGRLFSYFLASLQRVNENLGREVGRVLRAGQLPPADVISATLINDVLAHGRSLLVVLDDFHVIQDPFTLRVVQQLLDALPPELHLVLVTREDPPLPLARLRAGNLLTEIRARDLHFALRESEQFLNDVMALSLSQTDISRLEEKTEGWIAGLQLAALAMSTAPHATDSDANPSALIDNLSGSHRFILSYLTEQVLDRQPDEIRRFLLQTSILNRLTGSLCDVVRQRADSEPLLKQLQGANLFLIPLDDQGRWYRYHHLFADLLRSLLRNEPEMDPTDLHQRAARWYAGAAERSADDQVALIGEALEHALAASDYAFAVTLLDRHAWALIMQGYADTVNGWLAAIPEKWLGHSPRTDLAFAWMHLLRGAYEEATPYLERAGKVVRRAPEVNGRSALHAQWLAMHALLLQMEGRVAESEASARQAWETAPHGDEYARGLAGFALGSALRSARKNRDAVEIYRQAIRHARASDDLAVEMLSTAALAEMAFEQGQLRLVAEIARPVVNRLQNASSLPPISGIIYGLLGETHYQWLELQEARRLIRRALELNRLGGYKSGHINCRMLLSRLAKLEGDLEDAERHLQLAADLAQGPLPDYVRRELAAQQVRLQVALNRPGDARLALRREFVPLGDVLATVNCDSATGRSFLPDFPPDGGLSHASGLLYNSALRLLLLQARTGADDVRRGHELAGQLAESALQERYLFVALEALLLRARLGEMSRGGITPESAAAYAQALALAAPEGIAAVFVEQGPPLATALAAILEQAPPDGVDAAFVRRIISAARAQPGVPSRPDTESQPTLVEPLTERELEVLALIGRGLTYKEIAGALFISLNTVRFHVKAIYGKLGVNRRARAVDKARRLDLI